MLMAPAERPAPRRWAAVEALAAWAAARLREDPPDRGRDQGRGRDQARDHARNRDGTGTLLANDQVSQALSQLTADDAALLIARTPALAPDHIVARPLSGGPIAAGEARDHVRDQLTRSELAPLTPPRSCWSASWPRTRSGTAGTRSSCGCCAARG
ncbi:hypothetical protein GCM10009574_046620 [Streptomyces asiaticus]